jgi:hypothetical protein
MARSAPRTVRYGVIEWYPSGIGFTAKVIFLAAFITASPFFSGLMNPEPLLDDPKFLADSPNGK